MPNAGPSDGKRSAKLLIGMKRTQLAIAIAYFFDCLVLLGFHLSGLVSLEVPVIVFVLLASMVGAVYLAHATRWSLKRKDPTLFLPQQLFAISIALGTAVAAPQIAFQPFATLFAISAFSFMAPNTKSLVVCWIAAAIGAVTVIFVEGPRLAMPTASLEGQA